MIEIPAYKDELRNTWYASFYYTDWQGKRRLKKKRGFQRKKDAQAFEEEFLRTRARSCGSIENCADLVSGLCPVCRRERAAHLAQLQSDYQEALQAGDPAASVEIAQLIRDYQQSEGVRLKNVPEAYRVS